MRHPARARAGRGFALLAWAFAGVACLDPHYKDGTSASHAASTSATTGASTLSTTTTSAGAGGAGSSGGGAGSGGEGGGGAGTGCMPVCPQGACGNVTVCGQMVVCGACPGGKLCASTNLCETPVLVGARFGMAVSDSKTIEEDGLSIFVCDPNASPCVTGGLVLGQ